MAVLSTYTGSNADLIAHVASLYISDGMMVADVTYGKGVFWKKCEMKRFVLCGSDRHMPKQTLAQEELFAEYQKYFLTSELQCLPYRNASFDVVVLDPPYIHNPGNHLTDARYNNAKTTKGMYHKDILRDVYRPGIDEASRILKPGGQLWVKCKDEIESGEQRWSHREIFEVAVEYGFFGKDLFILHAASTTSANRWVRQLHSRKNHSYLWVFQWSGIHRNPVIARNYEGSNVVVRPNHRPKSTTNNQNVGSTSFEKPIHGNTIAYAMRRLKKDRPDLYAKCLAGMTTNAAMVEAGFRKKPPSRKKPDVQQEEEKRI